MERLSAPGTIERPSIEEDVPSLSDGYIVTVYDNEFNTVHEVIIVLMAATGCDLHEAEIETWEVHHLGRSVVHHASHEECKKVAEVIAQIGIRVEVSQE